MEKIGRERRERENNCEKSEVEERERGIGERGRKGNEIGIVKERENVKSKEGVGDNEIKERVEKRKMEERGKNER